MKHRVEDTLANEAYKPSRLHYTADDFDGYHAAPLLLMGREVDARLVIKQDVLAWRMADAAYGEVSKVAKDPVAMFVARATIGRMNQREGMNGISYMHRKHTTPQPELVPGVSPDKVLEACHLARIGEGSPVQNDMARRAFGMSSAELANLTIFNQFRKNMEPAMWDAVSELTGSDATPVSDQMYGLEILEFWPKIIYESQHVGAVRVKMKRRIGTLDDGAEVKVRTTAIINTSPSSGFDQDILEQFKQYKDAENPYEAMAEHPQFQGAVKWLIDTELGEGLVLARNETVYECTDDAKPL